VALINLEFLMGVAVALLYRRGWHPRSLFLIGLVPLSAWFVMGSPHEYSVIVGLGLAFLILPMVGLEREGKIRVPATLIFLGAASYAIYLVHNPLMAVTARFFGQSRWLILAGSIAVGTGGGIAYYWLFERRLLNAVRRLEPRSTRQIAS
jgi:peptidoglycan/LPS O-acetylase OafA/YrhL